MKLRDEKTWVRARSLIYIHSGLRVHVLVLKYKRTSDPGVADRLSKLNMHSVRKKGTRLSMRLSSTLGLANVVKFD